MNTIIRTIKNTVILSTLMLFACSTLQAAGAQALAQLADAQHLTDAKSLFDLEQKNNPKLTIKLATNLINCITTIPHITPGDFGQLMGAMEPTKKLILVMLNTLYDYIETLRKQNPSLKPYDARLGQASAYIKKASTYVKPAAPKKNTAIQGATLTDLEALVINETRPFVLIIETTFTRLQSDEEIALHLAALSEANSPTKAIADQSTSMLTDFQELFKKALAKQLSGNEICQLVAFLKSSAYTKIKINIVKILEAIKAAFLPETQKKIDAMLADLGKAFQGLPDLCKEKCTN